MPMTEFKQFEFCVLRYVPNVMRGEFVNIGLLLFEPHPDGFGFVDLRMTSDWQRATCLDRQIDVEVLQALEADLRTRLKHPESVGSVLHQLEDSFANWIQISPRQPCLATEPTQELETLCSLYLDDPQLESLPAAARPKSEHAMILAGIEDALTRAGIWGLRMEKTAAAKYTKKRGDSLVFDFGFLVGPEVRFFQPVPLKTNTNKALILAHRFPKVADSIHATTGSRALLTAVVSDDLDRTNPDIDFALGTFKENGVKVATVADMALIADQTRKDLNALGRSKGK
jgi:hypothetical protein